MGSALSTCFGIRGKKEVRILLLGLDNAGKTTTLYRLKVQSAVSTVPTVGFNVESYLLDKKYKLNIWDVGGQDKIRPLWRHYYAGSKGLAFVIDSQDRDRLEEARKELSRVVADSQMQDVPILIFANKQDLPHAMREEELLRGLEIEKLEGHKWHIQKSCAMNGEGLVEGFRWLATAQNQSAKKKSSK